MASRAGLPMQDIRSMQYDYLFFVEYFTLDLRMSDDGHCLRVLAMFIEDASIDRFAAHPTVIASEGFGRAYQYCTSAYTCTGDGGAMASRAGLPMQAIVHTL